MTNRYDLDRSGKRRKSKSQHKKDEKPSHRQAKKPPPYESRSPAAETQYVYSSNGQHSGPWNTEAYHHDRRLEDEELGQDGYHDQGSSAQQPDHLNEDDYNESSEYQDDEETPIEVHSATWGQGQGQPTTGYGTIEMVTTTQGTYESVPTAIGAPYPGSSQYPGYASVSYRYSTQPQPHITDTWRREDGDDVDNNSSYRGDDHSAQYYSGPPPTSGRRAEPYVDEDASMILQLSSRSSTWNSQSSSDENADACPETYSQENSLLGMEFGRGGDLMASLAPIPRRLALLDEESSNPGPRADGDAANQPQLDLLPPPTCVLMNDSGSSSYYLMTLPDRTASASASHYDPQSHSYSSSSSASSSLPSYTTRDGQSHSSSHSNRRRGQDSHNTGGRRRDRSDRQR